MVPAHHQSGGKGVLLLFLSPKLTNSKVPHCFLGGVGWDGVEERGREVLVPTFVPESKTNKIFNSHIFGRGVFVPQSKADKIPKSHIFFGGGGVFVDFISFFQILCHPKWFCPTLYLDHK